MKQILFVIAMKKEATDIAEKLELEKVNENVYRNECKLWDFTRARGKKDIR